MNIYDEMLNKYAQFIGYNGKVKADEKYLRDEVEKLSSIMIAENTLSEIKSRNTEKYGRTIFLGYNESCAYKTEGLTRRGTDWDSMIIEQFYKYKEEKPCICFEIDVRGNTYREITIDEVADNLHLR